MLYRLPFDIVFVNYAIISNVVEMHQKPDFDNGKIGAETQ